MTYVDSYAVQYEFDASQGVSQTSQATAATNAFAQAQARQVAATNAQTAAIKAQAAAFQQARAGGSFGNPGTRGSNPFGQPSVSVRSVPGTNQAQTAAFNGFQATYRQNRASAGVASSFGGGGGSFGGGGGSFNGGGSGGRNPINSSPFRPNVPGVTTQAVGKSLFVDLSESLDSLRDKASAVAQAFRPLERLVGSIGAMAAAAVAGSLALMRTAADFDALKMSLRAFDGRGSEAELGRLRQIGKAPGLGFTGAVNAYTGLRNADFDPRTSERIIKEVANANARGGGNNETFETVMMHLREMASQQYANERNIRGISNARIPINHILQDQFGTADTEQLKAKGVTSQQVIAGLIDSLSKLERVAGSERTTFDNVGDAIHNAEVAAGEGLNKGLLPYVNDFMAAVEKETDGGDIESAFRDAAQNIAEIFDGQEDGLKGVLKDLEKAVVQFSIYARNLAENSQGAADMASKAWRWIRGGPQNDPDDESEGHWKTAAGEADWSQKGNEAEAAGMRITRAHQSYAAAKKAGFTGSQKDWDALNQEGRAKYEQAPAGKTSVHPMDAKATPLLERIAIATEKTAGQDDADSGGGSLVRNGTSAQQIESITGHGKLGRLLGEVVQEIAVLTSQGGTAKRLRQGGI